MAVMELERRVADLATHPKRLLIRGALRRGRLGSDVLHRQPGDREHLADIAWGEAADIDRAVAAARAAFEGPWRT